MNFEATIKNIDDLIRTGNRESAILALKEIKVSSIPRNHINSLANLARRTGQLNLAWQIIAPVIRPKVTLDKPATDEEKATYAIILLGLGAVPEAIELLQASDQNCPDVNLAFAFASIHTWDYATAITKLKTYLRAEDLAPYQQMIAKVNLAASYVATGDAKNAYPLLQEILQTTKEQNWFLLQKNALEISAQLAIQQQSWDEAQKFLSQAIDDGEKHFNLDNFFIRKWQAVIRLLKDGANPQALQEIESVSQVAETNKHWETIRDCDYYKAVVTKDQSLALKLYFGTPFASYRKRLMDRGEGWLSIPNEYSYSFQNETSDRVFHLGRGEEVGGAAQIKPGTVLYKLFVALASDFYRPFSVGSLHSLVYPKEHFNPDSSPRRVAFLLQRLRAWFKENDIPLIVKSEKDGFKLQSTGSFTLLLEKELPLKSINTEEPLQYLTLIKKLKSQSRTQPYKAAEISELTNLSIRSVRYFLKWAVENKKVQKIGSGRESRYKFR